MSRVLPDEALLPEARRLAARLAKGPTRTLVKTRQLLEDAGNASLPEHLGIELESVMRCLETADMREGVAAFLERRRPVFTER